MNFEMFGNQVKHSFECLIFVFVFVFIQNRAVTVCLDFHLCNCCCFFYFVEW